MMNQIFLVQKRTLLSKNHFRQISNAALEVLQKSRKEQQQFLEKSRVDVPVEKVPKKKPFVKTMTRKELILREIKNSKSRQILEDLNVEDAERMDKLMKDVHIQSDISAATAKQYDPELAQPKEHIDPHALLREMERDELEEELENESPTSRLNKLHEIELRKICRDRGLDSNGKKEALILRIEANLAGVSELGDGEIDEEMVTEFDLEEYDELGDEPSIPKEEPTKEPAEAPSRPIDVIGRVPFDISAILTPNPSSKMAIDNHRVYQHSQSEEGGNFSGPLSQHLTELERRAESMKENWIAIEAPTSMGEWLQNPELSIENLSTIPFYPATSKLFSLAFVGAGNSGKSSLMNAIMGRKVSGVSHRVQTNDRSITCSCVERDAQLILTDTPSMAMAQQSFNVEEDIRNSIAMQDGFVFVIDGSRYSGDQTELQNQDMKVLRLLPQDLPIFLVFSKCDLGNPLTVTKMMVLEGQMKETHPVVGSFSVSSTDGSGIESLKAHFMKSAPEGPWRINSTKIKALVSPSEMFMAILREKMMISYAHELPYVAVHSDPMVQFNNGTIKILHTITFRKMTQRAIFIGSHGWMLNGLRSEVRAALTHIFNTPVEVHFHIKVKKNL